MTLMNGTLTAGQKRRTQTTGKSYGCLILLEKGSSTDCVSSASPTLVRLGDGWWQGGGGGRGEGVRAPHSEWPISLLLWLCTKLEKGLALTERFAGSNI